MLLEQIEELDAIAILQPTIFAQVLDLESEVERLELAEVLQARAKQLGVEMAFKKRLKAYQKDNEKVNAYIKDYGIQLDRDKNGKVLNSSNNYLTILRQDERFKGKLKLNELADMPEKVVHGKHQQWTDVDDSKTRTYIEKTYGIFSEKKLNDALNIVFKENSYNPVKDIIEPIEWDGVSRIYTLLSKWLGVEDDAYSREVSRLVFAGGINRLYNPGCKFDDMPVLIGTKQGEGKSSFVSWLALQEDFFREVKEIEGQKGVEILQGAWICEMGELLALTKAKEVEAVKAYITCKADSYRKPYERRLTTNKRHCIFIGTTNKAEFLTDKTGNRRFYPVTVDCSGYDLFDNKDAIMEDIRQCWAEALHLYRQGELKPYADRNLVDEIRARQDAAMEDDYRVGMIEKYMATKTRVCVLEIWQKALKEYGSPTRKDSCDIGVILSKVKGWERAKKPTRFEEYGLQKYWEKVEQPF